MNLIFNEYKEQISYTVGELIEKLLKYSQDMSLQISDADCGGHDTCTCNYVAITEDSGTLSLGHLEYAMYESIQKKEITKEDCNRLRTNKN